MDEDATDASWAQQELEEWERELRADPAFDAWLDSLELIHDEDHDND